LPTSARPSCLPIVLLTLLLAFGFFALPAPAQDSATAAPLSIHDDSATTGCGTATNIGSGNVAPLYVDGLPCVKAKTPFWNEPYTNIRFCAPGSNTDCQVIDHIIVDSGSVGLRLVSAAVKNALFAKMPTVTTGGKTVTECETYVRSYTYGPLKTADVYIAGKVVRNFPIQVIGASGYPVPDDCANQAPKDSTETDTVASFYGNGLIGVDFPLADDGRYYACTTSGKSCVVNSAYSKIPNLVSKFDADNNGVVMSLPLISYAGSKAPVIGSLTFGVGTEPNNKPPAGAVPLVNHFKNDTFVFNLQVGATNQAGTTSASAYIDSGTSDLALAPPSWPLCKDDEAGGNQYVCPPGYGEFPLGFYSSDKTAPQFQIGVTVGNSTTLQSNGDVAYNDIAEIPDKSSLPGTVALGLSFFFGKSNYFVFDGKESPLGNGPINAISTAYAAVDLKSLGGGESGVGGINDSGEVVGTSLTANKVWHWFLYDGLKMKDLGANDRYGYPQDATAVNGRGEAVGGNGVFAFLYSGGKPILLSLCGPDPCAVGQANGINDSGEVVGDSVPSPFENQPHAFLYSAGKMIDLGTLCGPDISYCDSQANGINDGGEIVGWSELENENEHAFLYSGGKMTDVGALIGPQYWSFANGINDSGEVVGSVLGYYVSEQMGTSYSRAFLYDGGKPTVLGTLCGPDFPYCDSYAYGINDSGEIVGWSTTSAFLYNSEGMLDLDDLVALPPGVLLTGDYGVTVNNIAINNVGQIAVTGSNYHAYLLTPQ
jgi:probable HAF family extracellular repeat protein